MAARTDVAMVCRDHVLTEKIIVTTASSGGRQLRERLAAAGTPWMNLHAMTPAGLARHLLGAWHPVVRAAGSPGQLRRLMARVCKETLDDSSYFTGLRENGGLHRALLRAIGDCRMAGLDPAQVASGHFSDERKADDFRRVAQAFAAACKRDSCLMEADVMEEACAASERVTTDRIILVEEEFFEGMSALERRLLQHAGHVHLIAHRGSAVLRARRAERPEWELRAALRGILDEGRRWDEAELILAQPALLPFAYELTRQLDIPCTFDPGVPLQYSKAARTVSAYLRWISNDFDGAALIRMMYDGVPDFSEWKYDEVRGGRLSCAALLREAAVGWGRSRCLERIDARIEELERACESEEASERLHRQIREYRADRAWIARLLEVTPRQDSDGRLSLHALAGALHILVTQMSRDKYPGEQEALERIATMLDDYREGTELLLPVSDLAAMIEEDIRATTYPLVLQAPGMDAKRTTTPEPGHLHVSLIDRGGWSGRRCTVIVGVDADTLPARPVQNPVLLDSERQRLNAAYGTALPLASDGIQRSVSSWNALLHRLEGDVTLSWSDTGGADGRPRHPSRLLVEAVRGNMGGTAPGDEKVGHSTPGESGSSPFDLIPCGAVAQGACLSPAERWLQVRQRQGGKPTAVAMKTWLPLLARGEEAQRLRAGDVFTQFDGFVGDGAPIERVLERAISASGLETLASCPYRFFLERVLHLAEPEDWQRREDRWLDAAQRGQAVHRILQLFMQFKMGEEATAVSDADRQQLMQLCDEVLEEYAAANPVPSESVRREEERGIRAMPDIFLREEQTRHAHPVALERSFGHARGESDPLPPLELATSAGPLLISGTIDRVDVLDDGRLSVCDYKTGKNRIKPDLGLHGGRVLQHALYTEAVRALFPEAHAAEQLQAVYFFLSPREQGARVSIPYTRNELMDTLAAFRGLLSTGAFPHSAVKQDCEHCRFSDLCGDAETVSRQSATKLSNHDNSMLDAYRRIHD